MKKNLIAVLVLVLTSVASYAAESENITAQNNLISAIITRDLNEVKNAIAGGAQLNSFQFLGLNPLGIAIENYKRDTNKANDEAHRAVIIYLMSISKNDIVCKTVDRERNALLQALIDSQAVAPNNGEKLLCIVQLLCSNPMFKQPMRENYSVLSPIFSAAEYEFYKFQEYWRLNNSEKKAYALRILYTMDQNLTIMVNSNNSLRLKHTKQYWDKIRNLLPELRQDMALVGMTAEPVDAPVTHEEHEQQSRFEQERDRVLEKMINSSWLSGDDAKRFANTVKAERFFGSFDNRMLMYLPKKQ